VVIRIKLKFVFRCFAGSWSVMSSIGFKLPRRRICRFASVASLAISFVPESRKTKKLMQARLGNLGVLQDHTAK